MGDESELLRVLLNGMPEAEAAETVEALKQAEPEKPAGRRQRRRQRFIPRRRTTTPPAHADK